MNPYAKKLLKLYEKNPDKFFARYEKLAMSNEVRFVLIHKTKQFIANTNGVGSYVGFSGWLMSMLPLWVIDLVLNRIFGMDITPASDLHDNEYCFPDTFEDYLQAGKHKATADDDFRGNIEIMINRDQLFDCLDDYRREKANAYKIILTIAGKDSFYENKTIINS
jgi:hypothetical protein